METSSKTDTIGIPETATDSILPESTIPPATPPEAEPNPDETQGERPADLELTKEDPRAEVIDLAQKVPALFLRLAKFSPRLHLPNLS